MATFKICEINNIEKKLLLAENEGTIKNAVRKFVLNSFNYLEEIIEKNTPASLKIWPT